MTHQQSFGNAAALIALGAALNPAAQQVVNIVSEAARAKEATAEQVYQDWLNIVGERIAGEQLLLGTANAPPYVVTGEEQGMTGEGELFVVLNFLDGLSARLFTRRVDVGELSNYMSGDARRWRTLLRELRLRSRGAQETARYHQLTRALAALEFLASEPISDAERLNFSLDDVTVEVQEATSEVTVRGSIRSRAAGTVATPNVAICLRDVDGNVCGEAIVAPPAPTMHGHQIAAFEASIHSDGEVSDVEHNFTWRSTGGQHQAFLLEDLTAEAQPDGRIIVRGLVRNRTTGTKAGPDIQICLLDVAGEPCGQTAVALNSVEMRGHQAKKFEAIVESAGHASNVEIQTLPVAGSNAALKLPVSRR